MKSTEANRYTEINTQTETRTGTAQDYTIHSWSTQSTATDSQTKAQIQTETAENKRNNTHRNMQ